MSYDETQTYVPLRLVRVVLRENADQQWIFLQEIVEDGDPSTGRGFPIVIGSNEAGELHRVLTDMRTPRPLTHQLATSLVEALGARIIGVDVVDLRQNTFYARIRLLKEDGDDEVHVDARPSDALALALRTGARIRIAESVLEQVRTDSNVDKLPEPGKGPGLGGPGLGGPDLGGPGLDSLGPFLPGLGPTSGPPEADDDDPDVFDFGDPADDD